MLLLEFDKAGAEWVIVAYLSGDPTMINVLESGKSPHIVTGALLSGASEDLVKREAALVKNKTNQDEVFEARRPIEKELEDADLKILPRTMSIRQAGKKANHGLNYREGYRMFALSNEMPETDAKPIVEAYSTKVYPCISSVFWAMIDETMRTHRTLTNCFGRKVRLMDEFGPDLLKAATSFIPQSTVFDMVRRAMTAAYDSDLPCFRRADLLTQTHDSSTHQYPISDWILMGEFCVRYAELLSPEIEYNFRKFKVGNDLKVGLDWGHMKEVRLLPNAQDMARELRNTWEELQSGQEAQ